MLTEDVALVLSSPFNCPNLTSLFFCKCTGSSLRVHFWNVYWERKGRKFILYTMCFEPCIGGFSQSPQTVIEWLQGMFHICYVSAWYSGTPAAYTLPTHKRRVSPLRWQDRALSQLPGSFWILKIGPLLREIWPKMSQKAQFTVKFSKIFWGRTPTPPGLCKFSDIPLVPGLV